MSELFPPPSELVAVAWLKAALAPFSAVGTTLPAAEQMPDGFVQALVVGGTPSVDLPVRQPVVSVDAWAATASSSTRPPWGKASVLAERVRVASEGPRVTLVELPANYRPAVVMAAYLRTEPRRVPDDQGAFAHYSMDVQLVWREAS